MASTCLPLLMAGIVAGVRGRLDDGDVIVHCGAGMGRAGTIAVGVLVAAGLDAGTALTRVAAARPGAGPESGPQADLVAAWAAGRG